MHEKALEGRRRKRAKKSATVLGLIKGAIQKYYRAGTPDRRKVLSKRAKELASGCPEAIEEFKQMTQNGLRDAGFSVVEARAVYTRIRRWLGVVAAAPGDSDSSDDEPPWAEGEWLTDDEVVDDEVAR